MRSPRQPQFVTHHGCSYRWLLSELTPIIDHFLIPERNLLPTAVLTDVVVDGVVTGHIILLSQQVFHVLTCPNRSSRQCRASIAIQSRMAIRVAVECYSEPKGGGSNTKSAVPAAAPRIQRSLGVKVRL